MSKNIAIAAKDFNWGGGLDFIHMISEALVLKSKEQDVKIYLFVPKKPSILIKAAKSIRSIVKVPYDFYKYNKKLYEKPEYFITSECCDCFSDLIGDIEVVYHQIGDIFFCKKLREYKIDIILPISAKIKSSKNEMYIGYIPDLQHKYYPEFFSEKEIEQRDNNFLPLLRSSKRIIVTSKSAKNDIIKFYGQYFHQEKCKIHIIPHTPLLKTKYKTSQFNILKEKYNLPEKYFIVSNQMWKHKDHITAFKALKNLIYENEEFKDVNIVCTGSTYDYRFPNLFEELKKEIINMGIENNIYFLGYIPKGDQLIIMKNSIAVIQTTLFEGSPGGGAVDDAVSMGIPAIVSDIDVNKEIDEENIVFFKTRSDEELAVKMKGMLETHRDNNEEKLLLKSNQRLNKLSDVLYKIIND
jgi:glycosyltransferase involved in cell wall biosynthesis